MPMIKNSWIAFAAILLTQFTGVVASSQEKAIKEFVADHCLDCHKGSEAKAGLDLVRLDLSLDRPKTRTKWIQAFDRVDANEMPPDGNQVDSQHRATFLKHLGESLRRAERTEIEKLGRGPLRRLTRTEYEDNLRDLLRLPDLDVADRLPEDREVHGFTKVARLLDMSRVQLAGYLDAAEAALLEAVASGVQPPNSKSHRFTGKALFPGMATFGGREAMFFAMNGKMLDNAKVNALQPKQSEKMELALFRSATWPYYGYPGSFVAPRAGRYQVRFSARAVRQLPGYRLVPAYDPLAMSFRARQRSGPDVSGDVRETGGWMDLLPQAKVFQTTVLLKKGETFEYSLLGLPVPFIRTDGGFFYDFPPMPRDGHRGAAFQWLEVKGPLAPKEWPPKSHRVLFGDLPMRQSPRGNRIPILVEVQQPKDQAKKLFQRFAHLASRRPLSQQDQQPFLELIHAKLDDGAPFAEAMLKGYQAFLCSTHFLYLSEPKGDSYPLAERLSHLLWNSRPDARLSKLAAGEQLSPDKLRLEFDRMIKDNRLDRFVANFTRQWLDLRQLRRDNPDVRLYPEYRKDDYLVDSMERQTHAFFKAMLLENASVSHLVDADFVYVNDRLAAHYGLPRLAGSQMRRVKLPVWSPYGGLLTHASVLKLTSNGTTTSPVVRGSWVMSKLLGNPPPPPPATVPAIAPDIRGATTIREQLKKHTEDPTCAKCHARFDPVGFALENFDIMGAWRDRYRGLESGEKITGFDRAGHPFEYRIGKVVDPAGKLLSGAAFKDVRELKELLARKKRMLARNLLQHLVLYATGTPVRFGDRDEIEEMLDRCKPEFGLRDLMRELVGSRVFAGK